MARAYRWEGAASAVASIAAVAALPAGSDKGLRRPGQAKARTPHGNFCRDFEGNARQKLRTALNLIASSAMPSSKGGHVEKAPKGTEASEAFPRHITQARLVSVRNALLAKQVLMLMRHLDALAIARIVLD